MPYLDQTPLYNQFDFNLATNGYQDSTSPPSGGIRGGWGSGANPNEALVTTEITTLLCPSDEGQGNIEVRTDATGYIANHARTNYGFCAGGHGNGWPGGAFYNIYISSASNLADGRTGIKYRGMFGFNGAARFSDVRDGLSRTIAVGELAIAGRSNDAYTAIWAGYRRYGTFINNHPNIDANHINNARYHINGPLHVPGMTGSGGTADNRWHVGVASSVHTGGAQFLFGDGSTQFLSENMDNNVYALLTRISDNQADQF